MGWINLSKFFSIRLKNTIKYKEYVEGLELSYWRDENFGNDYIRIYYELKASEKYRQLNEEEQKKVKQFFEGSYYYVFPISTRSQRLMYSDSQEFIRLLEFKYIYLSFASFLVAQLEEHFPRDFPIKVKSLDNWPDLNHVESLFRNINFSMNGYKAQFQSDYQWDVWQWQELHRLGLDSRKIFLEEKSSFAVRDSDFPEVYSREFNRSHIRSILLEYKVPVHIKGDKTIEEVRIHTLSFARAILMSIKHLQEDESWSLSYKLREIYQRRLLLYYLREKASDHLKQLIDEVYGEQYLDELDLRIGDVLELINGRLVILKALKVKVMDDIQVSYKILKDNLTESSRGKTVSVGSINYSLGADLLEKYKAQNTIIRLELFKKWMGKRKRKVLLKNK